MRWHRLPPTAPSQLARELDPDEARERLALVAAQEGWGTTLRYGFLRVVDRRWPLASISLGSLITVTAALRWRSG